MLKRAFLTYVRPLLKYNVVVWSLVTMLQAGYWSNRAIPAKVFQTLAGAQELIVWRTSKISGLAHPWTAPLMHWSHRRYKILFGLVHFNADHLFQLRSNQSRGHRFKLYKQFSISNTRSSFFTQRVINVWNNLPMSVEFGSLSAFTQSIGRVNLNQFLTVYKFPLAC